MSKARAIPRKTAISGYNYNDPSSTRREECRGRDLNPRSLSGLGTGAENLWIMSSAHDVIIPEPG
jgi:hypothetical protein